MVTLVGVYSYESLCTMHYMWVMLFHLDLFLCAYIHLNLRVLKWIEVDTLASKQGLKNVDYIYSVNALFQLPMLPFV
jgi:hypothetical protein